MPIWCVRVFHRFIIDCTRDTSSLIVHTNIWRFTTLVNRVYHFITLSRNGISSPVFLSWWNVTSGIWDLGHSGTGNYHVCIFVFTVVVIIKLIDRCEIVSLFSQYIPSTFFSPTSRTFTFWVNKLIQEIQINQTLNHRQTRILLRTKVRAARSQDFCGSQFMLLIVMWMDSDGEKKIGPFHRTVLLNCVYSLQAVSDKV